MTADPSDASKLPGVRVTAPKCVRCAQPVQPRTRPFCSQRCADIDLGAWLTESYRVPTDQGMDSEDDEGPEKA